MYSPTPLPTSVASGLTSSSFLRRYFLLISIAWLALSAETRAVTPAPDGGYAGNNTAEGTSALFSLTSGADNTANGFQALFHNTSGTYNSGEGFRALFSNTTGVLNTATGVQALNSNTIGAQNTATGVNALFSNTTASYNTANGTSALFHNTTGSQNTATGVNALANNTTGNSNTANGVNTLYRNTGDSNTATGVQALFNNTTGNDNTGIGTGALFSNTTGDQNTAVGRNALRNNNTGTGNIALGRDAGTDPGIGSNNIYIADTGFAGDNNVIAIGAISASGTAYAKCFIGGIFGTTVTGSAVQVGSDGQLGVATSSKRFKDDIKPMDRASESILALQPVTFRYKKEIDAGSAPQFGLVAEEVAEVNPDLVIYRDGQPYTVRYDQVNAMLLNEFLKEHRKVEQLQLTLAQQQKEMRTVLTRLKKQESQIQKVSAQLEVSKPGPETVASNK